MSSYITKGGSALVIFRANDEKLDKLYLDIGNGIEFKPTRYKEDGVYVTLFAWPFNLDNFNPIIVAVDEAKNITKFKLRYL